MRARKTILFIAAMLMLVGFAGPDNEITSKEQLNQPGMRVAVNTGSASMLIAEKELDKAEIVFYTDNATVYEAVAQGKVDAFVYDERQMNLAIDEGLKGVHLLPDTLDETVKIAVGISPVSKIPSLEDKINQFIEEVKNDGTLDEMYTRWNKDIDSPMPDIELPENPEYHLVVGTSGVVPPYNFYAGNELTGYDIELAYRFAAWIGADVEFKIYDFSGMIPAAASGDVDCLMSNLNITPERAEALPFSVPLYEETMGIMVRGDESAEADNPVGSFITEVKTSFEKTFIREGRWRLFIQGIITTLIITVLSIIFGTALGFVVYLICRNGNGAANKITGFFVWLVQGMPMVVLLMILYYVVFGKVAISGGAVSVIGFTLVFGASVFEMIRIGVDAVDKGQMEAALALGYDSQKAFYRIILPQALPHVFPMYLGEIVTLIKATAIVGYIAVQDITKVGDIIRSRTYEAFFPLIAVAVAYFILSAVLIALVKKIGRLTDYKKRDKERILKGV